MEELVAASFPHNLTTGTMPSTPARSPTEDNTLNAALDSLEGLVIGLYSEAMSAAVSLINKAISTSIHTVASILLVDTPGFQNPASCGQQIGATLSDLKHNYLQVNIKFFKF